MKIRKIDGKIIKSCKRCSWNINVHCTFPGVGGQKVPNNGRFPKWCPLENHSVEIVVNLDALETDVYHLNVTGCPECNHIVFEASNYCFHCGVKIKWRSK